MLARRALAKGPYRFEVLFRNRLSSRNRLFEPLRPDVRALKLE